MVSLITLSTAASMKGNRLYLRQDNLILLRRSHDTTGCQAGWTTGCQTGWTTGWMFV